MAVVAPARFDGLQSLAAPGNALSVDAGAGWLPATVAAGEYYAARWTAGAGDTNQLCEVFEVAVDTVGASTVVFDRNTGFVTVRNAGGLNLSIRFDGHTAPGVVDVGVMLGLIPVTAAASPILGPIAPGAYLVGPYQHYYGWFPDRCTSQVEGRIDREGVLSADAVTTVAPSGRPMTTEYYEQTTQPSIQIGKLAVDRVLTSPTAQTFTSYEQFWKRILKRGQRFRYYAQRTQTTAPWVYVADGRTAAGGTTTKVVKRFRDFYGELMNVDIGTHLYVA